MLTIDKIEAATLADIDAHQPWTKCGRLLPGVTPFRCLYCNGARGCWIGLHTTYDTAMEWDRLEVGDACDIGDRRLSKAGLRIDGLMFGLAECWGELQQIHDESENGDPPEPMKSAVRAWADKWRAKLNVTAGGA